MALVVARAFSAQPFAPARSTAPRSRRTNALMASYAQLHLEQQCDHGRLGTAAAATCRADATRRTMVFGGAAAIGATIVLRSFAASAASDFVRTPSGLLVQDITVGAGTSPQPGDLVVVHWAGYTKNYQAKRIENTSQRDEPYTFRLGAHEAIPAFEEAVAGMRVGGVRRAEVPGEREELYWPRKREDRYQGMNKYRYGPQPSAFDGLRALEFVLDNNVLDATNRTLLLDIKLLAVRPGNRQ